MIFQFYCSPACIWVGVVMYEDKTDVVMAGLKQFVIGLSCKKYLRFVDCKVVYCCGISCYAWNS